MSITVDLGNIGEVLDNLKKIRSNLPKNTEELIKILAEIGVQTAQIGFNSAAYDGESAGNVVSYRRVDQNHYIVRAEGATVLFVEFGAGITYWVRYSEAEMNGMGPGTYPGQTHAFSSSGWWYTDENGARHHSYGNPPAMAMYNATKEIERNAKIIAQEVLMK